MALRLTTIMCGQSLNVEGHCTGPRLEQFFAYKSEHQIQQVDSIVL